MRDHARRQHRSSIALLALPASAELSPKENRRAARLWFCHGKRHLLHRIAQARRDDANLVSGCAFRGARAKQQQSQ